MANMKQKAIELREQGLTYPEIVEALGGEVSLDWCKRNLKGIKKDNNDVEIVRRLKEKALTEEGCSTQEAKIIVFEVTGEIVSASKIRSLRNLAKRENPDCVFHLRGGDVSDYEVPLGYYVYSVYVDNVLIYIGKGVGLRWTHTISGTSHVYELNEAHFSNRDVRVEIVYEGLDTDIAHALEQSLITTTPYLANKRTAGNQFFSNYQETEKVNRIIYESYE